MTLVLTGPPPSWKAQLESEDLQNVKRGAEFVSLTGVAATRLGSGDWIYIVDTTAASRQVILPRSADEVGHLHTVKRISGGANTCVVSSEGGTLDGSASYSIATQYVAVHRLVTFDGAAKTARFITGEAQLIADRRAFLNAVRPLVQGSSATAITVQIGKRDRLVDSVSWTSASAMNANGLCPVRANARFHRLRMDISAGFTQAMGFDLSAGREGVR